MTKSVYYLVLLFSGIFTVVCCKKTADSSNSAQFTYENISVEQAREIAASGDDVIFLDVRTPEETAEGMISGAREINYRADNFKELVSKLNKKDSYVVYCRSGSRSQSASEIMIELGFEDVKNMEGGYLGWTEE